MKKLLILFVVLLVGAGIAAFALLKGKRLEIEITGEQIETALSERFPMKKDFLVLFELTYSNPEVELLAENDRVRVSLDADLDINLGKESKNLGGSCSVTCGLDYRAEEHAFYLVDPVFEKLLIGGIPEKYTEKVNDFASKAASAYVARFPVYTLRATDRKMAVAKAVLKDVDVESGVIVISLGL